jgi:transposase
MDRYLRVPLYYAVSLNVLMLSHSDLPVQFNYINTHRATLTPPERMVLVIDNLGAPTRPLPSTRTFPPAEAKPLAEKLEIHYTPKYSSWLNMAEIELSILGRQCLDRRVPDFETFQAELWAWQERRNAAGGMMINWRFASEGARIKPKRLHPLLQE